MPAGPCPSRVRCDAISGQINRIAATFNITRAVGPIAACRR